MGRDLADEGKCADKAGAFDQRHCMYRLDEVSKRLKFEESESVTVKYPKEGWTELQSMKTQETNE